MALINCPQCGHSISDKAKQCPNCGCEIASADNGLQPPYDPEDIEPQPKSNLKWLLIAIAVVIVGGAAGYYLYSEHKRQEEANLAAEQARLDSLALAQAEAARLDSIRQDSIERRNFTTPDLVFKELHGHVAQCYWKSEARNSYIYTGTFDFSEDGLLTSRGISRNKEGQIKTMKEYTDYDSISKVYSYTWANDKPSKLYYQSYGYSDDSGSMTFHYDNDGLLVKLTEARKDDGFTTTRNNQTVYSDYEFDEMGNWIKRKVTWSYEWKNNYTYNSKDPYRPVVEYEDSWHKVGDSCIEIRAITYYPGNPTKK